MHTILITKIPYIQGLKLFEIYFWKIILQVHCKKLQVNWNSTENLILISMLSQNHFKEKILSMLFPTATVAKVNPWIFPIDMWISY